MRCPAFGVDILHLAVFGHKPTAALHKTAESAQITVVAERRVCAFARDHFQIADVFYMSGAASSKACACRDFSRPDRSTLFFLL